LPPHRLEIHPTPKDGVAIAWKSPIAGALEIRGRVVDVDPNCGDGVEWELTKISGEAVRSLAKGAIPSGGAEDIAKSVLHLNDIKTGEFLQLAVFPKGGYECDSTMVEWEIAEHSGQKRVWNLNNDVVPDLLAGNPHADSFGNADVWYFRDLAKKNLEAPANSGLAQWLQIFSLSPRGTSGEKAGERGNLKKDSSSPRPSRPSDGREGGEPRAEIKPIAEKIQRELLEANSTNSPFYQSFSTPRGSFWAPLRNEAKAFPIEAKDTLQKYKAELADLRSHPPGSVVMTHGLQEGGVPESPHAGVHDVKIHVRGRYDRLGDLAPRKFPRLLAGDEQQPITEGSGRLQLAKWLANPTNPLTARVMMNRIWQQHFGEGIVRTPNNYGKLGTPPTHPELLDYLAHRFVESGWSIKTMHRTIMLSATYQQSSIPDQATLQADPENKLLGRMNRRRLDAESLRDSTLTVAGRLDRTFGGPAIRDLNNNRRTLYLMTIRSDRSNYRALFDAADPNAIVEQRVVSTVAPQALFLLNHPFLLAQTDALAERASALPKATDKRKIEWLYENLYGRKPSPAEIKIGLDALAQAQSSLGKNEKLAWEEYCQVLLCANEFVYVD
jgi:hypothetical protein